MVAGNGLLRQAAMPSRISESLIQLPNQKSLIQKASSSNAIYRN
jgi:hypothetical protein